MPTAAPRWNNFLMEALPPDTMRRWTSHLALSRLDLGQVLSEPGQTLSFLYFPTTALVSLLHVMHNGDTSEIGLVGRDGILGTWSFMGGGPTGTRSVVQSAGYAYRLPAPVLASEFDHGGPAMHLLLRYTQALFSQMAQTAACNRYHTIEQQLCRWLLLSLDRLDGNQLEMTHELIANMLGVRREGVTHAAMKLQRLGMIRYHRGHIAVLDRAGVERCSCECYQAVCAEYTRLLPEWPAEFARHAGG